MSQGLTFDLLKAALVVAFVSYCIVRRDLSFITAISVTTIKFAIPTIYFAWFYDGAWTLMDDLTYLAQGYTLLNSSFNPITILISDTGIMELKKLAGGPHFLYGWWNFLSDYLFGPYYYSPVLLNVGLTFVAGSMLYRICRLCNFSQMYARGLLLFFLLHWDVLVWSSFFNLKDTLILTLTVTSLYFMLRLAVCRSFPDIAWVAAIFFVFLWLRFYIPILLTAAYACWVMLRVRGRWRFGVLFLATAAFIAYLPDNLNALLVRINMENLFFGALRFALTPQPWSLDASYTFLLLPSMLHWLFFLPAILGGFALWLRSREPAFLLIYVVVIILFYGLYPENQGPRHRVQISFITAWMQYHFIRLYLTQLKR